MEALIEHLKRMRDDGASDLFIVAGTYVREKVGARFVNISEQRIFADDTQRLIMALYELAGDRTMKDLEKGDDDFAVSVPDLKARYRVNIYRQRGSLAAVVRRVPFDIPKPEDYHIPEEIMSLADLEKGMVLITGPAGSGKSTTLACIIDRINRSKDSHIITLEDPIEFLHQHNKSIVSQREVGLDSKDYHSALRASLRQAPNVLLLGEMRDNETIQTALTAAETGHLLFATLHTRSAANTVSRIVDVFPGEQQQTQIRIQLCMALHTVVCQQLLPTVDGGRIPAYEIMKMSSTTISSLIREGSVHKIEDAISKGRNEGMRTMDQSILALYKEGRISREIAIQYAMHPAKMRQELG